MLRVHQWLRRSFLSAFALLILLQVSLLSLGTGLVLKRYSANQLAYLEKLALQIIKNPAELSVQTPQHAGPFFVFSADKNLLYSNRGKGRSIPEADYRPVAYEGRVIGYFYAGEVRFLATESNRLFLASLSVLLAGSLLLSLGMALLFSLRAARRIEEPVVEIARDIHEIRGLRRVPRRSFALEELSRISANLNEVSELLAGEEEYKREWMQNIAHDLRTPISALRGQLEGMRDGVLAVSPERYEKNLAELSRLEEMSASITQLSRIEQLRKATKSSVAADQLISELLSPFEAAAEEKGITINSRRAVDRLEADPALLLRALRNILDNAIRYSQSGTSITISLEASAPGRAQISIANNGPSIPEEQLEKIFQRFYRGESSRTSTGTGLGLTIAREIARLHDGELTVHNINPTGVEFIFRL